MPCRVYGERGLQSRTRALDGKHDILTLLLVQCRDDLRDIGAGDGVNCYDTVSRDQMPLRTAIFGDSIHDEGHTQRAKALFCAEKTLHHILGQANRFHGTATTHHDFVSIDER